MIVLTWHLQAMWRVLKIGVRISYLISMEHATCD